MMDENREQTSYVEKCPHFSTSVKKKVVVDTLHEKGLSEKCEHCPTDKKCTVLWLCLCCAYQACGFEYDEHILRHFQSFSNTHSLFMNMRTYRVWCYSCNSYLKPDIMKKLSRTIIYLRKEDVWKTSSQNKHMLVKENSGKPKSKKHKRTNMHKSPLQNISCLENHSNHDSDSSKKAVWKPSIHLKQNLTVNETETEVLYREVRRILNQLTPANIHILSEQLKMLKIDTVDKLCGVGNMIFEKAFNDEFNYSLEYALLCKELSSLQVPLSLENTHEGRELVNFKSLLLERCQEEINKKYLDQPSKDIKIAEIESCENQEMKNKLIEELEEYDKKVKDQSKAGITFIGELFKQNLLSPFTICQYLSSLIDKEDENNLERISSLLILVGQELVCKLPHEFLYEHENSIIPRILETASRITKEKPCGISNRVMLMLQSVIDLEKRQWMPFEIWQSYKNIKYSGSESTFTQSEQHCDSDCMAKRSQSKLLSAPNEVNSVDLSSNTVEQNLKLTQDQAEYYSGTILYEFISDYSTVEETKEKIKSLIPGSCYAKIIIHGYYYGFKTTTYGRLKISRLFAYLLKHGDLSLGDYCTGLEKVLSEIHEIYKNDVKVHEYFSEISAHLFSERLLTLKRLHRSWKVEKSHAAKLLFLLFKGIVTEQNMDFLKYIWKASKLSLCDFVPESEVNIFIKDNDLNFVAKTRIPVSYKHLSYAEIHTKLREFFARKETFENIVDWITINVGMREKENEFIRILATAIFGDSIRGMTLDCEVLRGHYKLFRRYINEDPVYESHCIYALKAFVGCLGSPKGLLSSVCHQLQEDELFSKNMCCYI